MVSAGNDTRGLARLLDSRGLEYRPQSVLRAVGDLGSLAPTAAHAFDLVMAVSVLEYVEDVRATIAGMATCVRRDGLVLFTVPDPDSPVRRVERPVDWVSARVGPRLGVQRLAERSYSSTRPNGSRAVWRAALDEVSGKIIERRGLPLGLGGVRSLFRPSEVVLVAFA
jgi:SAM-dependent methyltransferase